MTPLTPRPTPPGRRSPLGLIVLWMLDQEPLHVYRIQRLLEQQGKDRVVNVRARASLYQALERLLRLGLVEVHATERHERYPDRVVYAITDAGRAAAREWLRDALRSAGDDYPEFIAAVSIMFALPPADVRAELAARADTVAATLAEAEAAVRDHPELPRLFLLEEEYRAAVLRAERDWLRGVVADLDAGRLTWSEPWLREMFGRLIARHDEEEPR